MVGYIIPPATHCRLQCNSQREAKIQVSTWASYLVIGEFLEPALNIPALKRAHQQINGLNIGTGVQQLLNENFAHKAGRSSDENGAALVKISDSHVLQLHCDRTEAALA